MQRKLAASFLQDKPLQDLSHICRASICLSSRNNSITAESILIKFYSWIFTKIHRNNLILVKIRL